MFSNNVVQTDATDAACAGTIVVLIDESTQMATPIAGGTKSKAESVATAVNSMLNQLATGPNVRLAIVGYGGTTDSVPAAQIRWAGPLSGRTLVNASELAASPARVEERVRRIPGAGGVGLAREEIIQFPIWYSPSNSGVGGIEQAADFVGQMLSEAGNDSSGKPPLVIHVCGRMPAANDMRSESTRAVLGTTVWCHLHLGATDRIPATLYPSSNQHLTNEDVAALFDASSVLAIPLAETLRTVQVAVAPTARALVYRAGMGDLIRFLMLAKAYASCSPDAFTSLGLIQPTVVANTAAVQAPPTPAVSENTTAAIDAAKTADRVALILLADRSQADPASKVWLRRQEQVNDMIGRIARRAGGDVDVGLIVYGNTTVDTGFTGDLAGKPLVPDVELTDGALRVEHVTEKVSNGIGGLVELKRSRPIFVQCEPSEPALNLEPAVMALAELIAYAREGSEDRQVLPLVMHVTGGNFAHETIATAAAKLAALGDLIVYHSIVPETPQRTLAYPADAKSIGDPDTAALWHMTSPLAGADTITQKRPAISQASRGFVVGAKFDLLLDSIQAILLAPAP